MVSFNTLECLRCDYKCRTCDAGNLSYCYECTKWTYPYTGYSCAVCGASDRIGCEYCGDTQCFRCLKGWSLDLSFHCVKDPAIEYCHKSCAPSGMELIDLVDSTYCSGPLISDCLQCPHIGKHPYDDGVQTGECGPCKEIGVLRCIPVGTPTAFRPGYFGPLATGIHPTPSYSDPPRSLSATVPWMLQCQHLHHLRSKKQYYTRLPNLQNA